ncbi:MAG: hypothetical protein IKX51_07670, partial [Bacteroidales bacterium]|nr:hypothetical protein [Bacteroidales bacterium]
MIGTGENFNKVVWEANDQITVNNSVLAMEEIDPDNLSHARFSGSASPNTYLESNKDVYRSVYPASIISSIPASASPMVVTLPATQAYDYTSPVAKVNNNYMAAYASVNRGGNLIVLKYRNLCSILKIQVTAPSGATGVDAQMSRLRFASASGVSGNFQVTFSNGIPVMTPSDPTADNILEIVYSTPVDITTTKTFFVMLPPMSSQGFVMQVVNGDGSKVIQKEKTSATFQRNKVYTTTINETFGDWGRTYSVSDNQRVYFAHGNLKYKLAGTDAGAWRFFDEQYGMCTSAEVENTLSQNNVSYSSRPSYVAVSQNGTDITPIINRANTIHDMDQWTDHFCFGTSGFQAGSIFYQPWHTFYGLVSNAGANRIYTDNGYGYG